MTPLETYYLNSNEAPLAEASGFSKRNTKTAQLFIRTLKGCGFLAAHV
jgi:hypothetical protein